MCISTGVARRVQLHTLAASFPSTQAQLETLSKEGGRPLAPSRPLHSLPSTSWIKHAFTQELSRPAWRAALPSPAHSNDAREQGAQHHTRLPAISATREELRPPASTSTTALGPTLVPAQSQHPWPHGAPPASHLEHGWHASPVSDNSPGYGTAKSLQLLYQQILFSYCLQCSTQRVTASPPVKQDSNPLNAPFPGKRNRLASAHFHYLMHGGNTSTARLLQSFKMVHNLQA